MPTEKGAVFSKPLTLGAVAQITEQDLYVATKAFPIVLADSLKGTYKYYDKDDLAKYEIELRKPTASYKRITLDVAEKTYLCRQYGLRYDVPIEIEGELGGDPLMVGADVLVDNGLQCLESNMVDTYLATSYWDNADITPTTKWDATGGNPIADIRAAKITVKNAGKRIPNAILCTEDVFEALLENDEILDRMPTDSMRILSKEEQLAAVFDVKYFFVTKAPSVTATEKLLLYYRDDVAPTQKPNAGLIIVRNYAGDIVDARGMGITEPVFDEDTDSDFIKLKLRFDMVSPATSLGVLFINQLT